MSCTLALLFEIDHCFAAVEYNFEAFALSGRPDFD